MSETTLAIVVAIVGLSGVIIGAAISGGTNYLISRKEQDRLRKSERIALISAAQEAMYEAADLAQDCLQAIRAEDDYKEIESQLRRQLNRFLILNMRLGKDQIERGATISRPIVDMINFQKKGKTAEVHAASERWSAAQDVVMDEYLKMAEDLGS